MSNRVCPTCFIEVPANGVCDDHGVAIVKTAPSVTAPERSTVTAPAPRPKASGDFLRTAREYLDGLGLTHVEVAWDQGRRRLGACHYLLGRPIRITLSRQMFAHMSDAEKWNTLTHEAAHALVPPANRFQRDGHTEEWRRKHIELGGDGRRCSDVDLPDEAYKWTGTCPNGHKVGRHAKSAKMYRTSCVKCSPYFDLRYKFTWVQNY